MMMVPTRILPLLTTRLLSRGTKFRMELFRAPAPRAGDESVAEFVEEHYGREAVDYLAEPLLSGIYGGDPTQLSVTSVLPRFVELAGRYGSLTRGVLAVRAKAHSSSPRAPLFRTLKGGLGAMVDAAAKAVEGRAEVRQARAETVERTAGGYRIRAAGEWIEARRVVVACEAHSAASLLAGLDSRLGELMVGVPHSSSMTVAMAYRAADFVKPPVGFGFLVPKEERRRLVACTWIGTKFPYRVSEGTIVARCFLGGMDDAGILSESDDAVIAAVVEDLRDIAGVTARPAFTRISRWPRSMAQYTVGHPARIAEIQSRTDALPGLHLAGNAYEGIGIPDCIRMGKRAAEKILASG